MIRAVTMALALVASPVQASDNLCKNMGEFAELVMTARQNEMPLSKMLELLASVKNNLPESTAAMRSIVLEAYNEHSYSTKEVQNRVIMEFRNRIETKCHQDYS